MRAMAAKEGRKDGLGKGKEEGRGEEGRGGGIVWGRAGKGGGYGVWRGWRGDAGGDESGSPYFNLGWCGGREMRGGAGTCRRHVSVIEARHRAFGGAEKSRMRRVSSLAHSPPCVAYPPPRVGGAPSAPASRAGAGAGAG